MNTPQVQERDFQAKSSAGIFGAPISWVAMFGALIGALSIVPFLFYPVGGGFTSVGMGIFAPIAGMLLGPWAGAVAGTIGGLIGMFISPGAYMFGFVDVFLSGASLPLAWGLMLPKYRKFGIAYFILVMIGAVVIPYHWPGKMLGLVGSEPTNILSYTSGWIALAAYLLLAKPIWNLMRSENNTRKFIGLLLINFLAVHVWMEPWMYVAYGIARFPFQVAITNTIGQTWATALPMTLTSTLIGFFLLRAMKQGNLRRVPGSYLSFDDEYKPNK